ncbi:MAG: hypothetical protein PUP92_37450, partial [Rhizonema sp. PD38]|nr:hypothetical protein [Rhizonema sp. PD38]
MNRRRKIPFIDRVKQQNALLLRRLGLPALAVLLIAVIIIVTFVNSTSAQTDSTTQAYAGFQGKIGRTLADSIPYWPQPKVASQGRPNQPPSTSP